MQEFSRIGLDISSQFRVSSSKLMTSQGRQGHTYYGARYRENHNIMAIPLKDAASLLWYIYCDPLRSLTSLSLNVFRQQSLRWLSLALKSLPS